MSETDQEPTRSLRIWPSDVLDALKSGSSVTFLDARSQKDWTQTEIQLPGSQRIRPLLLNPEPEWAEADLLIIY